jgi:ATP synthase F1 epsilon subunit
MATTRRKFALDILTPDGPVLSTQAVSLVLPAVDGQIGILGGHAPLLAMIGAGALKLEDDNARHRRFFVAGGLANVRENSVSVLAEQCLDAEGLQPATATAELDRATQMPTDTPEARMRRQAAVVLAQAKVRTVEQGRGQE